MAGNEEKGKHEPTVAKISGEETQRQGWEVRSPRNSQEKGPGIRCIWLGQLGELIEPCHLLGLFASKGRGGAVVVTGDSRHQTSIVKSRSLLPGL